MSSGADNNPFWAGVTIVIGTSIMVALGVSLTAFPGTPFNRALLPFKPLLWAAWLMVCITVLASAFFLALFQRFSLATIKYSDAMLDLMAAGVKFEAMDPSALAAEFAKATAARAAAHSLRRSSLGEDVQLESPKGPVSAMAGEGLRIPSLRNPNPLVDRPMDSLRQSRQMAAAQAQAVAESTSGRAVELNAVVSFAPPQVPELSSFPRVAL